MSESHEDVSIEELLQLTPQLQALAGHLAREWDQREDLVQDTWLRVLSRPPRERTNLSSWLRGALRMQRADSVRHQTATRRKQQPLPASEPEPTPDQLVERAEAHESVVRALRKLDEPYRQVLLLHYFEGLSVNEISRRMNLPRGTAATHLRRGRERLRAQLVSTHGDDANRICVLAAGPALATSLTGAGLTPSALPIALAAASIVALAVIVSPEASDQSSMDPRTPERQGAQVAQLDASAPTEAAQAPRQRTSLSTEEQSTFETVSMNGRCISANSGEPVPNATVTLNASPKRDGSESQAPLQTPITPGTIQVDAQGHFKLDFEYSEYHRYEIKIDAEGYAPLNGSWMAGWGAITYLRRQSDEFRQRRTDSGIPCSWPSR